VGGMAGRVRVGEISDDEGNRLKRIVRRGSGSVVTWRRAQMVLWSAQGMSVAPGDPDVVFCLDEFGPLNLQPRPGRQWARRGGTTREPGEAPRRRLRATYHRTGGVRHLFAALELGSDKMYGHIKRRKRRGEFLQFCRYVRQPAPGGCADRDRLR
jgi:hypothetical protein